jgi:hypothetical protein
MAVSVGGGVLLAAKLAPAIHVPQRLDVFAQPA